MFQHIFVFVLAVISLVVIQEVKTHHSATDLTAYDPFRTLKQKQTVEVSDGCFGLWKSKKKKKQTSNQVSTQTEQNQQYSFKHFWDHHLSDDTFTVSLGDFYSEAVAKNFLSSRSYATPDEKQNAGCKRVVVFSARGVILMYTPVFCDDKSLTTRLMIFEGTMWLYPYIMIKKTSDRDKFLVVTLATEGKETICEKKHFQIKPESKQAEVIEVKKATVEDDEDCREYTEGPSGIFPLSNTMKGLLLYPDKHFEWSMKLSDEPLGIEIMEFNSKICFRDVLLYADGKKFTKVLAFCGLLTGLVVSSQSVLFGNNLVFTRDSNAMTVVFNNRNGLCVKKQYINNKLVSSTTMYELDQQCKDLLQGKLIEQQMSSIWIESLKQQLSTRTVDVVPYHIDHDNNLGPQPLSAFELQSLWIDVNMGKDMGVVAYKYSDYMMMVLVAKGVVIDAAKVKTLPDMSIKEDSIYCGDVLLFRRESGKDIFTVVANHDNTFCSRTSYVLKEKNKKIYKQEIFPAKIAVSDNECYEILLRGKKKEDDNGSVYHPKIVDDGLEEYML